MRSCLAAVLSRPWATIGRHESASQFQVQDRPTRLMHRTLVDRYRCKDKKTPHSRSRQRSHAQSLQVSTTADGYQKRELRQSSVRIAESLSGCQPQRPKPRHTKQILICPEVAATDSAILTKCRVWRRTHCSASHQFLMRPRQICRHCTIRKNSRDRR